MGCVIYPVILLQLNTFFYYVYEIYILSNNALQLPFPSYSFVTYHLVTSVIASKTVIIGIVIGLTNYISVYQFLLKFITISILVKLANIATIQVNPI